jgi:succinate dehydrogenase / fumarate reductase, flavoprotein subunit
VIDRLAANKIDLTRMPVEVAPIAHYQMGGVVADAHMQTEIPGLFVAGEAVGGANGANRLSGNAITEALVFGRRAGRSAAERSNRNPLRAVATPPALDLLCADSARTHSNTAEMIARLQGIMEEDVGPFRSQAKLAHALADIDDLAQALGDRPPGNGQKFDLRRLEWFDLRNMLQVARVVAQAALRRTESRGAHQREDFVGMEPHWQVNQVARLRNGTVELS